MLRVRSGVSSESILHPQLLVEPPFSVVLNKRDEQLPVCYTARERLEKLPDRQTFRMGLQNSGEVFGCDSLPIARGWVRRGRATSAVGRLRAWNALSVSVSQKCGEKATSRMNMKTSCLMLERDCRLWKPLECPCCENRPATSSTSWIGRHQTSQHLWPRHHWQRLGPSSVVGSLEPE